MRKILHVHCDWQTMNIHVSISKINKSTGAYETNRYVTRPSSIATKLLCVIVDKYSVRSEYTGNGITWGILKKEGVTWYLEMPQEKQ